MLFSIAGGDAGVVVSSCVGSLRGKRRQRCFAPQPPEQYHDSIRNAYGTSSKNARRRWNTAAVRRGSAVKMLRDAQGPDPMGPRHAGPDSGRMTGHSESAGINRHVVGDERAGSAQAGGRRGDPSSAALPPDMAPDNGRFAQGTKSRRGIRRLADTSALPTLHGRRSMGANTLTTTHAPRALLGDARFTGHKGTYQQLHATRLLLALLLDWPDWQHPPAMVRNTWR